jgi:hypothetical protein
MVFAAWTAPAQEAGNYRSLAVMEFRFRGISEEQMRSVVDRLSLKILETQMIRRVVSPERRDQLILESGAGVRGGTYTKRQLENAAVIGVELAVVGEIRRDRNGTRIDLRLVEVATGSTLYGELRAYSSFDELLRDTEQMSSVLVRAAGQRRIAEPEDRSDRRKRELRTVAGFRIGQESVTAAPGIDGGSHLYAEIMAELNRVFALSLKYSLGLFPSYSQTHLISVLPRVNIPLAEDLYTALSAGYMISTDYRNEFRQYLGARLTPIHSGNIGGISIELFPLSVFFDLDGGKTVFLFELMSIAFWLPCE